MGNMISMRVTVSALVSSVNPGATAVTTNGARTIPANADRLASTMRSDATTLESFRAPSSSPRAIRPANAGMKEAERVPSPRRFRITLGIRKAALKASAVAPLPKYWANSRSLRSPRRRVTMIPAPTLVAGYVTLEDVRLAFVRRSGFLGLPVCRILEQSLDKLGLFLQGFEPAL